MDSYFLVSYGIQNNDNSCQIHGLNRLSYGENIVKIYPIFSLECYVKLSMAFLFLFSIYQM